MNDLKIVNTPLKRTLGLFSLIAVGVGMVIGQGALVTILQGVGINASAFFIAMLFAFALALTYIFTFTELSLMMPKAGGISSYTEVAIGHLPAIVITIGGYLGLAIFAGAADIFLLNYVFDVLYPGTFSNIGLWIYVIIIIFNFFGVDVFASVQNILAFTMLALLLLIGCVGVSSSEASDIPYGNLVSGFGSLHGNVLSLTVLALWAFMGMEFVCPMVEETKNPEKNLPRAMMVSAFVLLVVYGLVALAGYHKVPGTELVNNAIPHWILIQSVLGENTKLLMAILAVTAAGSSFSTGMAAISRMLYGMAKNNQLPRIFGAVHPKFKTPWFGLLFPCACAIVMYVVFKSSQDAVILMMISAATVWLLVYLVAHINLIVLRKRYPRYTRPYRSPFYPLPQILGIISLLYLIVNNSPTPEMTKDVYLNVFIIVGLTALYAVFWIKFKMKKGLFKAEPIDNV